MQQIVLPQQILAVVVSVGRAHHGVDVLQVGQPGVVHQVPATDVSAFILAGGTLALTAGVAIWLPARRASRADPIEILRT